MTPQDERPTPAQWSALEYATRHGGLVTESRGRGATRRLPTLRRHGWIDERDNLTAAGRAVVAAWTYDYETGDLRASAPPFGPEIEPGSVEDWQRRALIAEDNLSAALTQRDEETERANRAEAEVKHLRTTEHMILVRPNDMAALREWLACPNGSHRVGRVTFEAVENGGILVRTRPYTAEGGDHS